MQITLANPDRVPMCFIGPYRLTYEEPGPVDVDIDGLGPAEKRQLFFKIQRGVLTTEQRDKLHLLLPTPQLTKPVKPIATPEENDNKLLTKLLKKSVASVKKDAIELRLAQVRRLLILEEQSKNRKGLTKFLNELISKHQQEVMEELGAEELDATQLPDIGLDESQLSAVTDSEQEERTVPLPE